MYNAAAIETKAEPEWREMCICVLRNDTVPFQAELIDPNMVSACPSPT